MSERPRRILAIDPGSSLGWATDTTGRLEWGTEDFHIKRGESSGNRWLRFGRWLDETSRGVKGCNIGQARPTTLDLIVYEISHFMPKARAAAEIAAGFTTRLEEHCERHGIALQPVAVQTLKAFALPSPKRSAKKKGDPPRPKHDNGKAAMILAADGRLHKEGFGYARDGVEAPYPTFTRPLTEHEADALWILWWAEENC